MTVFTHPHIAPEVMSWSSENFPHYKLLDCYLSNEWLVNGVINMPSLNQQLVGKNSLIWRIRKPSFLSYASPRPVSVKCLLQSCWEINVKTIVQLHNWKVGSSRNTLHDKMSACDNVFLCLYTTSPKIFLYLSASPCKGLARILEGLHHHSWWYLGHA